MKIFLLCKMCKQNEERVSQKPFTPPQNTYVGQLETKQSPYSLPTAEGILNDMSV